MMKTGMKSYRILLTTLFLFVLAVPVHAGPKVGFDAKRTKVKVDDTFSLSIEAQGLTEIEGGGVSMFFNPSVLQVTNVTVNSATWTFVNRDGEIDNSAGKVTNILFSNYNGVSGSVPIATIEFQAIKRGKSKLRLVSSAVSPFASNGELVKVKHKRAVVRVRKK